MSISTAVRPVTAPGTTPNWYASVMGTGIVATAAVTLPVGVPGLRTFATIVWGLAVALLVRLAVGTVAHRSGRPDPRMAYFRGAPPMALLTVGAGTLLLGRDVLGEPVAVTIDALLWLAGTVLGLVTAVQVPLRQFTGDSDDEPFGGWLMPVVPPMVSAATGALLVPYCPAGQTRLTLLLACYALFGLSLIASVVTITLIWHRLTTRPPGPALLVPTLWIVLGPLGQSITAANLLGDVAPLALPAPYAEGFALIGVLYGVPVWGFALLWGCLAAAVTVRTARRRLPFSLAWWSFTFPVGTCVTGTSALARHTGSAMFAGAAVLLYAGLAATWLVVAVRTARNSGWSTGRPKW